MLSTIRAEFLGHDQYLGVQDFALRPLKISQLFSEPVHSQKKKNLAMTSNLRFDDEVRNLNV